MKRLVHGWAGQVIHGRVDDAKVFLLAGFEVKHFGQAHASVADQRAARFNHQLFIAKTLYVDLLKQLLPQHVGLWWGVVVVVDAQATAKINVF